MNARLLLRKIRKKKVEDKYRVESPKYEYICYECSKGINTGDYVLRKSECLNELRSWLVDSDDSDKKSVINMCYNCFNKENCKLECELCDEDKNCKYKYNPKYCGDNFEKFNYELVPIESRLLEENNYKDLNDKIEICYDCFNKKIAPKKYDLLEDDDIEKIVELENKVIDICMNIYKSKKMKKTRGLYNNLGQAKEWSKMTKKQQIKKVFNYMKENHNTNSEIFNRIYETL